MPHNEGHDCVATCAANNARSQHAVLIERLKNAYVGTSEKVQELLESYESTPLNSGKQSGRTDKGDRNYLTKLLRILM